MQREINIPNLRADDFMKYTEDLKHQELILKEYVNNEKDKEENQKNLDKLLKELENLYLEEFNIIENEINNINESQRFIKLRVKYK